MAEFVYQSESDDEELLPPAKIPKVESNYNDEEAAEFAPTGLDDEEEQKIGADDWVIGLVYDRTLARVDESHPLFGSHYLGQAVRSVARYGTNPQKVAEKRWREEDTEAFRVPKRVGLSAVIRKHGADAFEDAVIDFRIGYRRDVQPWADEQEKGMIAAYGGPLRDMHARLEQTLNLTDGGKGDVECKSRIALNNLVWRDFVLALTEFVDDHGTAYVPYNTILPSGYKLGRQVRCVRGGDLWKGWPDQEKRKSWLESLPKWTWNAAQSDERKAALSKGAKQQFATQEARDAVSERTKQQFANETDEQRAERIRRTNEGKRRPEVRDAASKKTKQQFATQEARDAVSQRTKQQFATQEGRDRNAEGHKNWWADLSADDRAEQIRKITEGSRRPEVRAAASEKTKQQFATQEARDLVAEGKRKAAKAKQEAKLATLSEAEQARARVIIKRNQDKQARRKRRLAALQRIAGWERAAMKDIPKAKAAGIVLQVCSCGVVCKCSGSVGSSS